MIRLMKGPFAAVHMTVPTDEVTRHGRGLRKRRRAIRATGTAALAGGVAVAAVVLPAGGGLQATLRADGIPARVTFNPVNAMNKPLPAGCTAPNLSGQANAQLQDKILTPPAIWAWNQQIRARVMATPIRITYTMNGHAKEVTEPRSGPAWYEKVDIGLYVGVDVQSPDNFNFGEDLVVTSQECTGS
jgi:hypothetical protein